MTEPDAHVCPPSLHLGTIRPSSLLAGQGLHATNICSSRWQLALTALTHNLSPGYHCISSFLCSALCLLLWATPPGTRSGGIAEWASTRRTTHSTAMADAGMGSEARIAELEAALQTERAQARQGRGQITPTCACVCEADRAPGSLPPPQAEANEMSYTLATQVGPWLPGFPHVVDLRAHGDHQRVPSFFAMFCSGTSKTSSGGRPKSRSCRRGLQPWKQRWPPTRR